MGRPSGSTAFVLSTSNLTDRLANYLATDPHAQEQLIEQLDSWAGCLRDASDLTEAERTIRIALQLAKKLAAGSPAEPSFQYQLAETHAGLGTVLQRAQRYQEAADAHRNQLAIHDKLAMSVPADPDYRFNQARAANFLGVALRWMPRELDNAIRQHEKALAICERLVAEFPMRRLFGNELARSHYAIGIVLRAKGRWADAKAAFWHGVKVSDQEMDSLADPPIPPSVQNDLAWLLATCPEENLRDYRDAVELARETVERDSRASYWNTLGVAEYRVGNNKAALEALQKAMDLNRGGDSCDWFFTAMAHWRLGHKDESRAWYERAVGWMQKHQPLNPELCRFRTEAASELGIVDQRTVK
jgi:tetratricopeptide (TPR) repeat protein